MGFRDYIDKIKKINTLKVVDKEVSKNLEIAGVLKSAEPTPVLFNKVKETKGRVIGNLFCNKDSVANYLGVKTSDLIPLMINAIEDRSPPEEIDNAPCQEVVEDKVDLDTIPILTHSKTDGGPYVSSAVVVTRDPEYGQNLDFHRSMQFSKDKFSVRVVKGRNFYEFLERNGELEVAFCIGNSPNILNAAATSVDIGIDELEIANALEPIQVTKAKTVDLKIPAKAEYVLEGKVYLDETHDEGPFIDLTETVDTIREQPVFEVTKITHRKDPIWQALLPGALEHKLLMGMPREPTIYKKVNDAGVKCLDVNINPGGCSWLHAIVQIEKKSESDPKTAIQATFKGHTSCKHVFVVDDDIDIYDPLSVEWAMATRFQGDARINFKSESETVTVLDLVKQAKRKGKVTKVPKKEPGSSLDPTGKPKTKLTQKIGFDFTAPLEVKGKNFKKATFPQVDLDDYF